MTTPTIARAALAPAAEVDAFDRLRLYEVASLLLSYPDADLVDAGYRIADSAADLMHEAVRQPVLDFLLWFSATDPAELERHYAAHYLCDHDPLRARDRDARDRLSVLLEFAAIFGPGEGEAPLRDHRSEIEFTRDTLAEEGSPYAYLLEALANSVSSSCDSPR